jgi:hypothetical protein
LKGGSRGSVWQISLALNDARQTRFVKVQCQAYSF